MRHTLTPGISIQGRRSNNEDNAWTTSWTDDAGRTVSILAVADGMGGHAHGEKASQIAIFGVEHAAENALAEAGTLSQVEIFSALQTLFDEIDRGLKIYSEKHPDTAGMGTTLVVAVAVDEQIYIAHIGDSRAYWVSRGGIQQLTRDHSASAEAVREGRMTQAEAARSPFQHALTRSLDGSGDSEPDVATHTAYDPGFLCLCTDGLTGAVSDEKIRTGLLQEGSAEQAARALVDFAYAEGSEDNISVAVLECGNVERSSAASFTRTLNEALAAGDLPDAAPQGAAASHGAAVSHGAPAGARTGAPRSPASSTPTRGGAPTWATRSLAVLSVLLVGLTGLYIYNYSGGSEGSGGTITEIGAFRGDEEEIEDDDPKDLASDSVESDSVESDSVESDSVESGLPIAIDTTDSPR